MKPGAPVKQTRATPTFVDGTWGVNRRTFYPFHREARLRNQASNFNLISALKAVSGGSVSRKESRPQQDALAKSSLGF